MLLDTVTIVVLLVICSLLAGIAGGLSGYLGAEFATRRREKIEFDGPEKQYAVQDLFPNDIDDVKEEEKKKERGFFG